MPSNGPVPDGPKPPASPAGPPAPAPEPAWDLTNEQLKSVNASLLTMIARLEAELAAAKAPGRATDEVLAWVGGLIQEARDGAGPLAGVRAFGQLKVFVRVTDVP